METILMGLRQTILYYAYHLLGTPYRWAGDDFSSFDCSGFCVELLKAAGLLSEKEDLNADGLYQRFKKYSQEIPYIGCLVFFGSEEKKTHVEFCLSASSMIGASGGGKNTLTYEDAVRDNAFVKIRPINSRKGPRWFVDPFLLKK